MMDGMFFLILVCKLPMVVDEDFRVCTGRNHFTEESIVFFLGMGFGNQPAFQPGNAAFLNDRDIQFGTLDGFNAVFCEFINLAAC